jgi:putative transposase
MDECDSSGHSAWECKYHMVFIPMCRQKALHEQLWRALGVVFRPLAYQKESAIEERHLMSGHAQTLIAIPPKYAVSQVVGGLHQGQECDPSGAGIRETKAGLRRSEFVDGGHFVSTVGGHEAAIRVYIQSQEQAGQRLDQLKVGY